MVFGNGNIDQPVKIGNYTLKNVTWFTYLGSVFTYDNNCSEDLWTRIGKAAEVTKSTENIWKIRTSTMTQKTYIGNSSIQHSAIWVWNLDIQHKDKRQTAGIWDVLLPKDPPYQMNRAKNKPWNMWKTQNWTGSATKSHSEETPIVWPYMQDGGQKEVRHWCSEL